MSFSYIDTHVSVWMHDGLISKLSSEAQREIDCSDLLISPMVYLELHYLFKRKRVNIDAPEMFANLNGTFGINMCTMPFSAIAVMAVKCTWTSDPFDRLIVANAWANRDAKLITSDHLIRENYRRSVW